MMDWKQKLFREVTFKAVKSQGPGGQNVNKVSSAAQIFWKPSSSQLFSEAQRALLVRKFSQGTSSRGIVTIYSQKFRDLPANKKACLAKLTMKIEDALKIEKPRRKTKPTRGAVERLAEQKRKRSHLKKLRAPIKS